MCQVCGNAFVEAAGAKHCKHKGAANMGEGANRLC